MLRFISVLASVAVLSAAQSVPVRQVPAYEVDPMWPKPLPNNWLVGAIAGIAVDARNHVWIVHRPGTLQPNETRSFWRAAPPVLEWDETGNLVYTVFPDRDRFHGDKPKHHRILLVLSKPVKAKAQ